MSAEGSGASPNVRQLSASRAMEYRLWPNVAVLVASSITQSKAFLRVPNKWRLAAALVASTLRLCTLPGAPPPPVPSRATATLEAPTPTGALTSNSSCMNS